MNLQPSTFNWPLARKLASYCAQAYDRADITDVATDAAAIVTLDENDDIVVAFRGSRAARDFVQDAKVRFTTLVITGAPSLCSASFEPSDPADPACGTGAPTTERVHEGFLQDFEAIDLAVTSNVRTYLTIHSHAKIYVTGHSLGGALAILCAYQFAKQNLPVAGVYTFGQPRVGNADFANGYDYETVFDLQDPKSEICSRNLGDLTFRIVNQNDLVPRVPGWLLGYRHCGQEIFLRPDGRAQANPTFIVKLLWDVVGLYGAYRNREDVLIREHHIGAYQERMQKAEL